jgi:hypothetical protein
MPVAQSQARLELVREPTGSLVEANRAPVSAGALTRVRTRESVDA